MSPSAAKTTTYDDLLEERSPPKFDQRYRVPQNAKIVYSPEDRWWRTNSPRARGRYDDNGSTGKSSPAQVEREEPTSQRRGVFDWNRNEETNTYYQITYTSISKPPEGASDEAKPTRCIAGYSGFIPGKYSGNTIGTAFTQSKIDADAHLRTTAQAIRFGVRKPQENLTI
ncbi:hypothetical protein FOZ61_007618 [Perkinsus olseni]|uniref:Uncharacterized protein n=1 Tax=Perkinsus olseni TaxID=32597 RepID=A0A7J6M8Q4_PEROL|nr:hypothetical protein FOZ61_007618 [Perkinsus olseni]KAF4671761.1 hypothetical protein FOL46_009918 [Perkinsus olseni]